MADLTEGRLHPLCNITVAKQENGCGRRDKDRNRWHECLGRSSHIIMCGCSNGAHTWKKKEATLCMKIDINDVWLLNKFNPTLVETLWQMILINLMKHFLEPDAIFSYGAIKSPLFWIFTRTEKNNAIQCDLQASMTDIFIWKCGTRDNLVSQHLRRILQRFV